MLLEHLVVQVNQILLHLPKGLTNHRLNLAKASVSTNTVEAIPLVFVFLSPFDVGSK